MILLRKQIQAATILLIFLIGTILVFPPKMDLELCFGSDGHIDLALNSCQDGSSPGTHTDERPTVYVTAHHNKCVDVAVICGIAQEFIRTNYESGPSKAMLEQNDSKVSLVSSKFFVDSRDAYENPQFYPFFFEEFSPHLVGLRTIVLLI